MAGDRVTYLILVLYFTSVVTRPIPTIVNLPAPYRGTCHEAFGKPVALVLEGDVPLVFAADHVIERYAPGVSGGSQFVLKTCHNIRGIVSAKPSRKSGIIYVASAEEIDRLYEDGKGGTSIGGALFPGLARGDRIETFAVGEKDQLEVVISTYGDDRRPRFLYFDHFMVGRAAATFKFASLLSRSAISSVVFGTMADFFAYDEDGKVFRFSRSNRSSGLVVGKIVATAPKSMLGSPGTRQIAIDSRGDIDVATDHCVSQYVAGFAGTFHLVGTVVAGDNDDLIDGIGVDKLRRLYVLTHSIASDDGPLVTIFGSHYQGKRLEWTPLKKDYVSLTASS